MIIVSAAFYFQRAMAALEGRLNQIAVDDLQRAVEMEPDNVDYLIEQASVCTRFNLTDEGINACQRIIELMPEYPDAHRLLGLCYIQKGDKAAARTALLRAKELGDPHAKGLIEKYGK